MLASFTSSTAIPPRREYKLLPLRSYLCIHSTRTAVFFACVGSEARRQSARLKTQQARNRERQQAGSQVQQYSYLNTSTSTIAGTTTYTSTNPNTNNTNTEPTQLTPTRTIARNPVTICVMPCHAVQNPMCPTMHFNYRYFETDGGVWWFGGGTDITPAYLDEVSGAMPCRGVHRCSGRVQS